MSVARRLKEFLDSQKVPYASHRHETAYTAQEVAAAEHVPGKALAKAVVLKAGGEYVMAVLPAHLHVDLPRFAEVSGRSQPALATEAEFQGLFPDAELGAMPPFGHLYGLPVYLDESMLEDEEITFNAGTHTDTVRMHLSDYRRLANPVVGRFGRLP